MSNPTNDFLVLRGGLVETQPDHLTVIDMDALDADTVTDEAVEDVRNLRDQIQVLSESYETESDDGAYLVSLVAECNSWLHRTGGDVRSVEKDDYPQAAAHLAATLVAVAPNGGYLACRLDASTEPPVLYIEDVALTDNDEDFDLPEEALGEPAYAEAMDSLNAMMDEGTLPGYTTGDKFYDFKF